MDEAAHDALIDMLEHAESAMARLEHRGVEDLLENKDLAWVMERLLITIGEAARRIPDPIRAQMELPWKRIVGMRNILTHDYGNVDQVAVTDTVHNRLPELVAQVQAFLSTNP